ncbi:hypothetical protein [Vibrio harveyi]|uniref:hypothetical protein n=1 Tax=Vibrio harveyi TaxID=669 RepID=UPI0018F215AE|nr:hypothetical protein [Vibrio harveyi]
MKSPVDKLLTKHQELIHSDGKTVTSHTQRDEDDWVLHTLMIEGCDVPFKFRRKKKYKSLTGQKVNITYYPESEMVAGFEFEVMRIVRIKLY